jgi:hypothetical protein
MVRRKEGACLYFSVVELELDQTSSECHIVHYIWSVDDCGFVREYTKP